MDKDLEVLFFPQDQETNISFQEAVAAMDQDQEIGGQHPDEIGEDEVEDKEERNKNNQEDDGDNNDNDDQDDGEDEENHDDDEEEEE